MHARPSRYKVTKGPSTRIGMWYSLSSFSLRIFKSLVLLATLDQPCGSVSPLRYIYIYTAQSSWQSPQACGYRRQHRLSSSLEAFPGSLLEVLKAHRWHLLLLTGLALWNLNVLYRPILNQDHHLGFAIGVLYHLPLMCCTTGQLSAR